MKSEICILPDGSRVRYSLQKRNRDPVYRVCFRRPNGERLERTTRETGKKRASHSAQSIIWKVYNPKPEINRPTWVDAIETMIRFMEGDNLRPGSIQQYQFAVNAIRKWSNAESPADVTEEMAHRFKADRMKQVKARTVRGNIENLSIVYGHWWIGKCKILARNPFDNVTPPKDEKKQARIITDDELKTFLDWLSERWGKIPVLFVEVKAKIGCRIGELAKLQREQLKDYRIHFTVNTTKGRKDRTSLLPQVLFDELCQLTDTGFVFAPFSDSLRAIHRKRGKPHHAKSVKDFTPKGFINWMQKQLAVYRKATGAEYFKLNNLRSTAMSRARTANINIDDAAIAFGCNPDTIRKHYLAIDEVAVSDSVMSKI